MLRHMRAQLVQTLTAWLDSAQREPLFLGGIRGVGKTTFVEEFAGRADRTLASVPLAERPQLQAAFESGDPGEILRLIGRLRGMPALEADCLLFLDDLHAGLEPQHACCSCSGSGWSCPFCTVAHRCA
jgi:predicted AAA+ superfamily ATPase